MIKKTFFEVIILMILLVQFSTQTPLQSITPTDWTEGSFTSACSTTLGGDPKIVQAQGLTVPLTNEYIYLKSSVIYYSYNDGDLTFYIQSIYKYYIQITGTSDTLQTNLQISLISGADGSIITQTYTIQNTYEFIDADGPYCLLKQTNSNGDVKLTLYSFDSTPSTSTLLQLSATAMIQNEILKSLTVHSGDKVPNGIYSNIVATLLSIDTQTSQVIVRSITSTGLDVQIYGFTVTDVNSNIYTHLQLGLQISGSNFYAYVTPLYYSGYAFPLVFANDQTAILTSSGLFSNHIVISSFSSSMMIATYDDGGQNGNIFFLLINMKTTSNAQTGSLQYLTDYQSYIIELNLDPTISSFYVVWSSSQRMYNFTFLNSLGDNKNAQIIADFSSQLKISSSLLSVDNDDDGSFFSKLHFWIYSSTSIIKYYLLTSQDGNGDLASIGINKEFSVQLDNNLLQNQIGSSFEATFQLKCLCQTTQLTDMICFYGNDACTFTVQTLSAYCTPSLG